jgi:hypothetical protein
LNGVRLRKSATVDAIVNLIDAATALPSAFRAALLLLLLTSVTKVE